MLYVCETKRGQGCYIVSLKEGDLNLWNKAHKQGAKGVGLIMNEQMSSILLWECMKIIIQRLWQFHVAVQ